MINCHHCQQKDEDIRKMNEFKEIILSANQTLTDHIKKQNQEIESLKYKNSYLSECALEEQTQLKNALRQCCPTKGFGNCYSCGLRFDTIWMNKDNEFQGHLPSCEYIKLIK